MNWVKRVVNVVAWQGWRDTDSVGLWLSLGFVFLMSANYCLQAYRDAQMMYVGTELSSKLLTASTGSSLLVGPWAKKIVKPTKQETSKALQMFYRCFLGLLLVGVFVDIDQASVRESWKTVFSCLFFLATQSINNLAISLLWSFSLDLLQDGIDEGQRVQYLSMFGAASTVGQALGASVASYLLFLGIPVSFILVLVALSLELASRCARVGASCITSKPNQEKSSTASKTRRGSNWREFWSYFDIYTGLLVLYTIFYTSTQSLIFLSRTAVISNLDLGTKDAASISARLSLSAAIVTFFLQIGLSSDRFGIGKFLGSPVGLWFGMWALPVITTAGFSILTTTDGSHRQMPLIFGFELVRRVVSFAVAKPIRENLYSIISREQKFVLKSIIDTFIYRSGFGLGAMVFDRIASSDFSKRQVLYIHIATGALWFIVSSLLAYRWSVVTNKDKTKEKVA